MRITILKLQTAYPGKLKSVSFYHVKGILVPKETMQITMINPNELEKDCFFDSHCWDKLKAIVLCSIKWNGKHSEQAELLSVTSLDFSQDDILIKEIEQDYEFIRAKLVNSGFDSLTGKDGKWIQARTKGQGGFNKKTGERNPITRAFYARKELVKRIFDSAS